jgi:hypothetical protein
MAWLLLIPPTLWLAILLLFAKPLRAAWREPVLSRPVLIIESDDWGPGPASHARALRQLIERLGAYRDDSGRRPVMTLGLTLSLPDSEAIAASGFTAYHPRLIIDPAYAEILAALRAGIEAGVFVPQLHGMAHYWPATVMRAAESDPAVRRWLTGGPGQETEALPSPLQSRWTDASVLPSRPLPAADIQAAVTEEVAFYRDVFGLPPQVAVPPTFVWNRSVELAWAEAGIHCVVTPGRRFESRDGTGRPVGPSDTISNGERGAGGLVFLVRDDYFEPAYGHRAERALAALMAKTAQGRPCLLETHRFNFTGDKAEAALKELGHLLDQALARFPTLRFSSCAELAEQYRLGGPWPERQLSRRYRAWLARLVNVPRFWKLARLSGLAFMLSIAAENR